MGVDLKLQLCGLERNETAAHVTQYRPPLFHLAILFPLSSFAAPNSSQVGSSQDRKGANGFDAAIINFSVCQ